MLLNSRMASIPCSSRHTVSYMKDIKDAFKNEAQTSLATFTSQSSTTVLQYFNTRVTQRLHHYRSMKRQWQEVATFVRNNSFVIPTYDSSTTVRDLSATAQDTSKNLPGIAQKSNTVPRGYRFNDCTATAISGKENNEKPLTELDPLHSRIQQDLFALRKLIKTRQRKFMGDNSFKVYNMRRSLQESTSIGIAVDDQENNNKAIIRKSTSLRKLKSLDRVKISGCKMNQSTFHKNVTNDGRIISASNSSSRCSQYSKQQQPRKTKRKKNNKTCNILYGQLNPTPSIFPADSFVDREFHESSTKACAPSSKVQSALSKQSLNFLLPIVKKERPNFTKQETLVSDILQLANDEKLTTDRYTYAASSSSIAPHSTMLKRNTSLLPILLHSTSCIGIQSRDTHPKMPEYDIEKDKKEQEETIFIRNDDDDCYYDLLDYKNLINGLPQPIVSIQPRYGKDDYGILFEQLDHIRETMPDSNIYHEYARVA